MRVTLLTSLSGGNQSINMSGISRYSASLYSELKRRENKERKENKEDKELHSVKAALLQTVPPSKIVVSIGKVLGKDLETFSRAIPLSFPKDIENEKPDILHCTSQMLALPLLYNKKIKKKCIVTVHDLIPVATNSYSSVAERFLYKLLLKALKKATYIIVDSEHTKKDVMKYVCYPEEKISVIPLGIDKQEFYEKKNKNAKETKRDKTTILYVGSDHERKNISLVIKALSLIKKEIPNIKFIKVGQAQDTQNRKRLLILAKQCGVDDNIIWKDYVENLADEYNKATVFVFPSLYEGFGFPVLEAMACGCPVICSNKTSLPELAGNATLYCDPYDEHDLAEKIIRVIKNKELREKLRKKGVKQAQKFTWKRCAEETYAVYKKVMPQI